MTNNSLGKAWSLTISLKKNLATWTASKPSTKSMPRSLPWLRWHREWHVQSCIFLPPLWLLVYAAFSNILSYFFQNLANKIDFLSFQSFYLFQNDQLVLQNAIPISLVHEVVLGKQSGVPLKRYPSCSRKSGYAPRFLATRSVYIMLKYFHEW